MNRTSLPRRFGRHTTLGLLCAALILSSSAASAAPEFEDVSDLLQWERIDDPLSAHLGGAAWLDYDGDGDLDLLLVNTIGGDNALFEYDGGVFVDVAEAAGITGDGNGFTGALAGDLDNDGCTDLFLSGAGGFLGVGIPSALYRNNCDGTFSDVTAGSGIDANHLALMAAFGDIDGDGLLDLYVTSPGDFNTGILTPQKLYRNQGGFSFADISASAGIDTVLGGCVAGFSDFNGDRLPDILVGNCANLDTSGPVPFPIPGPWELWINQGDLTFVDVAVEAGFAARPGFPMAVTQADCDLDGDLEIFSTGMGPNNPFSPGLLGEQVLFRNEGDLQFSDGSAESGLAGWEWGWGASFGDYDNDGDDDLAVVGSVAGEEFAFLGEFASPGRVFENGGDCDFSPVADFGLENEATSGLAVADYDADGYLDIVMVKTAFDIVLPGGDPASGDGRPVLLRNLGNDRRALTLQLIGTESNAMAIGARVRAITQDATLLREVVAGSSFASTNSPFVHFGLGERRRAIVVVEWPSGLDELFVMSARRGVQEVVEGTGIPF